jgi:integrase
MGVCLNLKYVKDLGGGKYQFRKPYPPSLRAALGQQLKVTHTVRSDAELLRWWSALVAQWDKTVAAQRRLDAAPEGTKLEMWRDSAMRAAQLLDGVQGLDDDQAREVLAEHIAAKYPTDVEGVGPVGITAQDASLLAALTKPTTTPPEPTLRDALALYLKEQVGEDAKGRRGRGTRGGVERVFGYAYKALGTRADAPLTELGAADGRAVRDLMLSRVKTTGEKVSPASVRRELNTLTAALKIAIHGFDLEKGDRAKNIFKGLKIAGESDAKESELRTSLPPLILAQITQRLETQKERRNSALPDLRLLWRILVGTGCRVAEVAGLTVADVVTTGKYPHIKVRFNENRRIKTKTSRRAVPLCGDALEAARTAVDASTGRSLFARYSGPAGGNNASAALMKHVNAITSNPQHVVHSLRHNMADWLRLSRAPQRAEKLILGHSLGGTGDTVYGSDPASLELTTDAMRAAHARAEEELREALAAEKTTDL